MNIEIEKEEEIVMVEGLGRVQTRRLRLWN